jgi:excinuclease ABC subunit C
MTITAKKLKNYPKDTGVYIMKDKTGKVLYIGKAKNIKARLRQYFITNQDTRAMVNILTAQVDDIETILVNSEKEALILENTLIKKHLPKYNVLFKDDKSYMSLMLTNEKWPRVKIVRKKTISSKKDKNKYFGPYTNGLAAKMVFNLLCKIFKLRQCSNGDFSSRTRPCILFDIKKCLGPCTNNCTHSLYLKHVKNVEDFLLGKNKKILSDLKKNMLAASKKLEFEKANDYLNMIKQINHISQNQYVENLSTKDLDVINFYHWNNNTIVLKLIFRNEKLIESSHFNFSNIANNDNDLLETFLYQHYDITNPPPPEILLPKKIKNKAIINQILNTYSKKKTSIITPKIGKKQKLIDLALKNAKSLAQTKQLQTESKEKILLYLQEKLSLNNYPKTIFCFDVSKISNSDIVASLVVFTGGQLDRSKKRLFKIKDEKNIGDCPALKEVLHRYFSKENLICDLLVLDGAKAQLNAALLVLKELNIITTDIISISKEKALHTKGLTREKIHLKNKKDPILLDAHSPLLFFVQKIRDEAHRAAISFHKKIRGKRIISSSLTNIPGIGKVKMQLLLKEFKSVANLKKANKKDLEKIAKLTKNDILNILKFIKK